MCCFLIFEVEYVYFFFTSRLTCSSNENGLNQSCFFPGSIADREHRKWTEQAVPLQNNPYSKESIERRLSRGISMDNLTPNRSNSR